MSISYTLKELAEKFSVELQGDPNSVITHVAPLESANSGAIAFLANAQYKRYLADTKATAVILAPGSEMDCQVSCLLSENPYLLYAKIADLLAGLEDCRWSERVHPSSVIHTSSEIHESVVVHPLCVIESDVSIGKDTVIGPGCVIQQGAVLGQNVRLIANVTIGRYCSVGNNVVMHAGVVVGSDGFGFANEDGRWLKIPQTGKVLIGDNVEIGAGSAIDRGANRNTIIEEGVKLDNIIHVAHNVRIGAHTAIAAMTGIAGSSSIGKYCTIGGRVSILGHVNIPDKTHINSCSFVSHSIEEPGNYSSGTPLEPSSSWRRNFVRFKQLDSMAKRLKTLEQKLTNQKLSKKD